MGIELPVGHLICQVATCCNNGIISLMVLQSTMPIEGRRETSRRALMYEVLMMEEPLVVMSTYSFHIAA